MLLKKIQLIFTLAVLGLGLTACGDDGSAGKSQPAATQASSSAASSNSSSGALEAYDPDVPAMAVEDNGVVQQEEIYKAWPQ